MMAENTTKPENHDKSENDNKVVEDGKEGRSVLAKIGKWLAGPKEEQGEPGPPAREAEVKKEEKEKTSQPAQQAQPAQAAKPPGSATGRKRPAGRSRSSRSRKTGSGGGDRQKLPAGKGEASKADQEVAPTGKGATPPAAAKKGKKAPIKGKNVIRKLLINTDEPEECRIAMIEDGRVEAFYVETLLHTQTKGNIYKVRVVSVEPSLQAAFVDMGGDKNGFLPFGEIHPEYFHGKVNPDTHWKDLPVDKLVRKGDQLLVQVVKEATGNKGANLTTFLSLPGRYLVLMPGSDSHGISRKIESEAERKKLRNLVESLTLPEGVGYIVRTASKEITKIAISQDLKYLLNLWTEIKSRGQNSPAPALIYKEQDIIARFLRDHYTSDISEIMVDNEDAFGKVEEFLGLIPARQKKAAARLHSGPRPIFNHYQVEKQIEQIYHPTVSLPSGGSIVINPTEALVAIDVNSGRTSKDKNFEESIFLANMEAAEELARQLRLRDLGGLIVVDFIDMRSSAHVREVEKKVKESMKEDKAKVDISRISRFGLMQISRQKLASPVQRGSYNICEHCQGRGVVRSVETLALVYLRRIQTGVTKKHVRQVECRLPIAVAEYLQNKKRQDLLEMETRYEVVINIEGDPAMSPTDNQLEFVRGE
ncbi:MAG: Rne/Rng family ribonuclease [Desulfobulbaceae bacterium]|nr:Rne/Rng family ribonuclease [Desulfobulbaceae bacterium]